MPSAKTGIKTIIDKINEKFKTTAGDILEAFDKCKGYHDRRAQAEQLKVGKYVVAQPKRQHSVAKIEF